MTYTYTIVEDDQVNNITDFTYDNQTFRISKVNKIWCVEYYYLEEEEAGWVAVGDWSTDKEETIQSAIAEYEENFKDWL